MGKASLQKGAGTWLPSLRKGKADWQCMLDSLGALYTQGVGVNWVGFDRDYQRHKLSLPTSPFERKRYWLDLVGSKLPVPQTGFHVGAEASRSEARFNPSRPRSGMSPIDVTRSSQIARMCSHTSIGRCMQRERLL